MIRKTPIKSQIYKTDIYLKHKKLIYKLAFKYLNSIDLDLDDLVSELNIVFCLCIRKYTPSKNCFSTYLYCCCKNHLLNLIKKQKQPKRNQAGKKTGDVDYLFVNEITTENKVILFDNFVNNKNPVIRSIIGIISVYKLPNKDFKTWLKGVLKSYGFKYTEITNAFKIIKTLY